MDFKTDPRFAGIEPFDRKLWLASPTMYGEEQHWVDEVIRTNWVSTVGANINEVEKQVAEYIGIDHAVALSCGTAALHLAIKLAGEKLYGAPRVGHGTLEGKRVMTVYVGEICRRNNRTGRLGTCCPSPKWRFPKRDKSPKDIVFTSISRHQEAPDLRFFSSIKKQFNYF